MLPEYFRLDKSTDAEATYVTKRAGSEPVRLTWTMAQASSAGLSVLPEGVMAAQSV